MTQIDWWWEVFFLHRCLFSKKKRFKRIFFFRIKKPHFNEWNEIYYMYKYELMMVKMVLNSRLSYMGKGFSSSLATVVGITSYFLCVLCSVFSLCVCSVNRQICEIPTQNPMSVKWPTCFSNKFEINARCFPGVNEKWKKKKLPVAQQYRSSVNSWNAIFMFDANLLIVFLCADEIHLMFSY